MDEENPPLDTELNLRLVDAGPVASGYATSTDDNCGSGNTGSDACSGG
ncbi:FxLD family lanthipeptide [Actinomadura rayongensis]|uniref:FxLD family lantipeptide n=1 Tax=Actinomadura rayongensis TaxID=1429076 RepID=A0A6I4WG79_9ACTN|nr:FxLD family lanthipeptide [Actinomadura rayongensis]MXQ65592.1 FxLD family lantipeptide [Actinomadura rayongensis]